MGTKAVQCRTMATYCRQFCTFLSLAFALALALESFARVAFFALSCASPSSNSTARSASASSSAFSSSSTGFACSPALSARSSTGCKYLTWSPSERWAGCLVHHHLPVIQQNLRILPCIEIIKLHTVPTSSTKQLQRACMHAQPQVHSRQHVLSGSTPFSVAPALK